MNIPNILKLGAYLAVISILILLLIFTIVLIIQLRSEFKRNSYKTIHINKK